MEATQKVSHDATSSEEKSPGQAACEAFWAHMGTGPDGQLPSAAWDWAKSQGAQGAWAAASQAAVGGAAGQRLVTFDLMSDDPDYYFVLTTALGDFAAQARAEAKEGTNPESNTRWAETAEDALWRIEMALSGNPRP